MLDGRDLQLLSNLLDQKLDEKLKPIQEDISVLKVEMKEVKQDVAVLKEDVNILKLDSAELKKGVRKLNDELIYKAKKVCPLSSHLIAYMSLQVEHEDWGYVS